MTHTAAVKTWIMVFWRLAMGLKEQTQITINTGLSRTGIKVPKILIFEIEMGVPFGISIWIQVLKPLSTLPKSLCHLG